MKNVDFVDAKGDKKLTNAVFRTIINASRMSKSKRKLRNGKQIKRKILLGSKSKKIMKSYYINQPFVFDEASKIFNQKPADINFEELKKSGRNVKFLEVDFASKENTKVQ